MSVIHEARLSIAAVHLGQGGDVAAGEDVLAIQGWVTPGVVRRPMEWIRATPSSASRRETCA